jgi:hypothetical protein
MRIQRISKAEQKRRERFMKIVCEGVEAAGGTRDPRGHEAGEYILQTPVGPLSIHIFDDWIANRFVSTKGGEAATHGCCGRTGKWNFHRCDAHDLFELAAHFRERLAAVLAYQPPPAVLRDVKLDLAEERVSRLRWAEFFNEETKRRESESPAA